MLRINGLPPQDVDYQRIVGYVQQGDLHVWLILFAIYFARKDPFIDLLLP